ncbi:TIGR03750 family conjugal transfer protein [Methylotuvimicrobium sp. KM1]|uniref:TIGR03750 family conjugal transfer protein n=1 Tax=Methylotuvimicrobium sp. KM1 TaxID=3377707 RepID=UPI00384E7318
MDAQDISTETLADRLNQEPVIFRGSTNSELGMILLCATVFWLPAGLLLAGLFGAPVMGLGIATLGVLATIVFGSTGFQRIKRGRPDFYYQHVLILKLNKFGLRSSSLIARQGPWDLGRTLPRSFHSHR